MYVISSIVLIIFTSVFLVEPISSSTNATTETSPSDEDEADAILENMNFAEFKERYRRLIPYRAFYVANNYVNTQVLPGGHQQQGHSYERETALTTNPLIRKPQRPVRVVRPIDPRRNPNGRGTSNRASDTQRKPDDKFVPSLEYDPKNIGVDTADYFTPVASKLHYDTVEYTETGNPTQYDRSQRRPVINPQTMILNTANSQRENKYRVINVSPSINSNNNLHTRKYLPNKPKRPIASLHQDYPLDYGTETSNVKSSYANADYNYPADDFEPVRYANVEQSRRNHAKPTRILAQSVSNRPNVQLSPFYATENLNVDIQDIMKSLQLTNRLPEMLNRDNIDSSIKTLVEILGILNNAKHGDSTKLTKNQLNQAPNRDLPDYEIERVYARPKVVTETRFQATPRPAIVQNDDITYVNEESYDRRVNYHVADKPKHQSVIEYYTPTVQDIDDADNSRFEPTERPQKLDDYREYTYGMTKDSEVDTMDEDEYASPITAETPISKFKLPDGVSTHTQLVPPTTLKYGATRGKPNIDYPAHAAIPKTDFNCKEQRYKGFFGDPTTGCQVWHYCDLNGGKSSFLCPNGTIFSQVALTCDWWFNVKCESTTQLYVLNERLYKYILPIIPKFPEDFSGPEVDRYLELKFKEMEAKLKEKKLKKQQEKDGVKEKLQALDTEDSE